MSFIANIVSTKSTNITDNDDVNISLIHGYLIQITKCLEFAKTMELIICIHSKGYLYEGNC